MEGLNGTLDAVVMCTIAIFAHATSKLGLSLVVFCCKNERALNFCVHAGS